MKYPGWIEKLLSVPLLKWLVGIIILLVLALWVSIRVAWLYKRRLLVEHRIRKVEKEYEKGASALKETNLHKIAELDTKRRSSLAELEEKREVIRKETAKGDKSIADLINKAFK